MELDQSVDTPLPQSRKEIGPTPFWLARSDPKDLDMGELRAQFKKLPPLNNLSPFFLARIIYKTSLYQKILYPRDKSSPVMALWKTIENEWLDNAQQKMHRFGDKGLTTIQYSLSDLRIFLKPEFQKALYAASLKYVGTYPKKDLANTMYAEAALGMQPPPEYVKEWAEGCRPYIGTFNDIDVSNIFYAIGRFDLGLPDDILIGLFANAAEVLKATKPCSTRCMSNIFYGVSKTRHLPNDDFWDAFFPLALQRCPTFNTMDVLYSMRSLIGLQNKLPQKYADQKRQLLSYLFDYCEKNPGAFQTEDLGFVLDNTTRLGHRPSKQLIDHIFDRTEKNLTTLPSAEILILLKGVYTQKIDKPELTEKMFREIEGRKVLRAVDMTMYLHAAGNLNHTPPQGFIEKAIKCIEAEWQYIAPHEKFNSVRLAEKMGYSVPKEFVDRLYAETERDFASYSPRTLGKIIIPAEKLQPPPPESWIKSLFSATFDKMEGSNDTDFANIPYALAEFHYIPDQAFLDRLYKEADGRLDSLLPSDLANLHHGVSKTDFAIPAWFMKRLTATVRNKITEFDAQSLINVLFAFSKFGMAHEEIIDLFTKATEPKGKISTFGPKDIESGLYLLTLMDADVPDALRDRLLAAATKHAWKFPPDIRANVLYSAAAFGYEPLVGFLEEFYPATESMMEQLEGPSLALLIHGFARMNVTPPPTFLQALYAQAEKKVHTLEDRDLIVILSSAGRLNIKPPESFMREWYKAAIEKIDKFSDIGLAMSLAAIARLGEKPPKEFLNAILEACEKKLDTFEPHSLATAYWAMGILSVIEPFSKKELSLAAKILEKLESTPLEDREQNECAQASAILFPGRTSSFKILPPETNRSEAKTTFLQHLEKTGFKQQDELAYLPEVGLQSDYAFRINGQTFLMDHDGRSRVNKSITDGATSLTGPALLKSALIARLRPEAILVRVQAGDAQAFQLRGNEEMFDRFKSGLTQLSPGAYTCAVAADGKIAFDPLPLAMPATKRLSGFWFNHFDEPDLKKLAKQYEKLPPLNEVGKFSLFKMLYTTGVFAKRYSLENKEEPAAIRNLWATKQNEWLAAITPKLMDYEARDLGEMLQAFAQMNSVPPQAFQEKFFEAVKAKREDFDIRDLSSLLFAGGNLDIQFPKGLLPVLYYSVNRKLAPDTHPLTLLKLMRGFDALEEKPPRRLVEKVLSNMQNQFDFLSLNDIQEVLVIADRLEVTHTQKFLDKMFAAARTKLVPASPYEMSSTLLASAKVRQKPPDDFLSAFFESAIEKRNEFKPSNLRNTLYALAQLGIRPPEKFVNSLFTAMESKLKTYSDHDFAMSLHSCGILGISPPESFLKQIPLVFDSAKIAKLTEQDLSTTAWGLAALSVKEPLPEETLEFARALIEEAKTRKLQPNQSHALAQACKWLKADETHFRFERMNESTTNDDLRAVAQAIGKHFKSGPNLNILPELQVKTDHAFLANGKRVLVEFDAGWDTLRDSETQKVYSDGSALLKAALICDADPEAVLLRIPTKYGKSLSSSPRLLSRLVSLIPDLPPGAHTVAMTGDNLFVNQLSLAKKPSPEFSAPQEARGSLEKPKLTGIKNPSL